MSGGGRELDQVPTNLTLELADAGRERLNAALEGMREFNPSLTAEALVAALFLYGLDRVELELTASRKLRDETGGPVLDDGEPSSRRIEVVKH